MLLWGRTVAWSIAGSSRAHLFRLGEKRLGTFGSLPVRGRGSPVECCLPLVQAGDALVSLGRLAERLRAGGQH
jgi:hypothetical protein